MRGGRRSDAFTGSATSNRSRPRPTVTNLNAMSGVDGSDAGMCQFQLLCDTPTEREAGRGPYVLRARGDQEGSA